jgi:hypothetical protein
MATAKLKTRANANSVTGFLAKVDPERRADCEAIVRLMSAATGEEPEMWGASVIGFGRYNYKYESGREGEWMMTGFSPRKNDLTLYIMPGVKAFPELVKKLGRHKTGVSCLYIKKLADVDTRVLKQLIETSVERLKSKRPA